MMFPTLEQARSMLRRLHYSKALVVQHLCQEDQVVLRAEGFGFQPWGDGWLVWRRVMGERV